MTDETNNNDFDLIYSYSRKQAIDDGVLLDVTEWAKEVGFRFPVAVTDSVWRDLEDIPEDRDWQDVRGRAHDLLTMAAHAAKNSKDGESEIFFSVILETSESTEASSSQDREKAALRKYKSHCGPGDEGEPVITIMQPDED